MCNSDFNFFRFWRGHQPPRDDRGIFTFLFWLDKLKKTGRCDCLSLTGLLGSVVTGNCLVFGLFRKLVAGLGCWGRLGGFTSAENINHRMILNLATYWWPATAKIIWQWLPEYWITGVVASVRCCCTKSIQIKWWKPTFCCFRCVGSLRAAPTPGTPPSLISSLSTYAPRKVKNF